MRGTRLDLTDAPFLAWRNQWNLLFILLSAGLVTCWRCARTAEGTLRHSKWIIAAPAVYAAGILLMLTNAQEAGLPLGSVLILLMLASVGHFSDSPAEAGWDTLRASQATCILVGLLFVGGSAALDAASVVQAVREKLRPPAQATLPFSPEHMSGLVLYDLQDPGHRLANSNGTRYVTVVNDGIRLLKERSSPAESVVALELMSPFSYALLRRPAPGGYTFLGYGGEFDEAHKPSARRLFGEADIVMVPKRNIDIPERYHGLLRNYLPDIQRMFAVAAESPYWWMYRRKL